ncbi:MAG: TetR/AcrR family transcriptional regulator [Desulfobacteraceae bacterium]|jgi:TetR/AcrR family fatty acid metabolism transcriptional regulator|nr:MAG: TetR/AcrR family transcriptional regulator [Desulfobacteraceae bacterium]
MARNRSQDKYYRIILAATRVFAKKGFFHSRISDIAKEAKVADGTIYIYFENKDAILIALFEEQMRAVLDNMVAQLAKEPDSVKRLEIFACTHLELIEQNPDMAEIIQVELRQSGKFMKEYRNERFAQYLDLIADIVREGQASGIFKEDVIPNVFKRAFFGALDEMSRFWVLSSRRHYDIRTAARQVSGYFIGGIRR